MSKTMWTILITAALTYMLRNQIGQLPLVNKLPSM